MHTFDVNTSNVPAFLIKLWKLVEDSSCDDLIAWSDSGASFIIKDPARFASELLPQYFKHNNMASFVRQLNMYGFRKVMNYERSGLRTDNNEMEFQHSFFVKEQSELLELIKRKIPNTRIVSEPLVKSNAKDMLTDLTSIRDKQESMDNMLLKLKRENELLWKELTNMRQKHKQQEQVLEKVIHFLVQVIRNQPVGIQKKVPRMLHDSPNCTGSSSQITTVDFLRKNPECLVVQDNSSGPVIHEVTDFDVEEPSHINSKKTLPLILKNSKKNLNKSTGPNIISLSPTVQSPAESETSKQADCPLSTSSLNSPIDSSIPLEPLSVLEPLQTRTSAINEDDLDDETVIGIPLEYVTASDVAASLNSGRENHVITLPKNSIVQEVISIPEKSNIRNVISLPEGSNVSNVISLPESSNVGNVISIPEGTNFSNIISIPEDNNISNVISIPEGSDISNIISIPEGSNINSVLSIPVSSSMGNVISIPEGSSISNIITIPNIKNEKSNTSLTSDNSSKSSEKVNALVAPDFYDPVCLGDMKVNYLNGEKSSLNPPLSKSDYIDSLMTESLNTPKVHLTDDTELSNLINREDEKKAQKKSTARFSPQMNVAQQEHDYLAPTSSSNATRSSTAKNALSNHLLIVEEELNRLQDNINTNSWDVDADKLLGLFSSDGMVSNEAFVDQLTDGITIKKEPEDILDSELSQLTPPILGVELEDLRSPFFEQFDPAIVNSGNLDDELSEKKDDLLVEGSLNHDLPTSDGYINNGTNTKKRKSSNSKVNKGKRRRVK